MSELIEVLADIEHKRWASWQRHVFSKCEMREDGTAVIPAWAVTNWKRQCETNYADLSESEKESDRREVRNTLKAMTEFAVRNI